jgi:hypothetical protein
MAKKKKNKKYKNPGWKKVRTGVSVVNQKHQVFAHKNTKRKKTRQAQEDAAIQDQKE